MMVAGDRFSLSVYLRQNELSIVVIVSGDPKRLTISDSEVPFGTKQYLRILGVVERYQRACRNLFGEKLG